MGSGHITGRYLLHVVAPSPGEDGVRSEGHSSHGADEPYVLREQLAGAGLNTHLYIHIYHIIYTLCSCVCVHIYMCMRVCVVCVCVCACVCV